MLGKNYTNVKHLSTLHYNCITISRLIKSRRVTWARHVARREIWEVHTTFLSENLKGRDHFGDLNVDGNLILKWMLNKYVARVWNGFIWLRMLTSSGVLWTHWQTWSFHKRWWFSWSAGLLLASQEAIFSMELDFAVCLFLTDRRLQSVKQYARQLPQKKVTLCFQELQRRGSRKNVYLNWLRLN
jgi:hypothetical protein